MKIKFETGTLIYLIPTIIAYSSEFGSFVDLTWLKWHLIFEKEK